MLLNISHTSNYSYDGPVSYALQQARLTPRQNKNQTIINWKIELVGAREEANFIDHFGNEVTLIQVEDGAERVEVHCQGAVETSDTSGVLGYRPGGPPLWYYKNTTDLTASGKQVRDLTRRVSDIEADIERLHALSSETLSAVTYTVGATSAETSAEDALKLGQGVCQDHAHIFIAVARILGYPARYVSGYLMMNDRVTQDATHAWAEAFVPNIGWVGFDISNGISPDARYVRLAVGLDYKDAAPISGLVFGDRKEALAVQVKVQQQ